MTVVLVVYCQSLGSNVVNSLVNVVRVDQFNKLQPADDALGDALGDAVSTGNTFDPGNITVKTAKCGSASSSATV